VSSRRISMNNPMNWVAGTKSFLINLCVQKTFLEGIYDK
jgi:hypothetical protein